ncbi:hypothetical protein BROUX41_002098 [Berkeleyomyces rouxiae]|uniref:uncharacterized protein n=1 Tax=Berkeleyomyces rouxiae TaxID=2035830 RepID=UPI003B819744
MLAPLLLLQLGLVRLAGALQVTPGSPCAQQCIDNTAADPFAALSSNTNASDIVCTDDAFGNAGAGTKFRECVECLQKSDKVNGTESDLHWLLYNLRFTLGTCLFNPAVLPEAQQINSPCLTPSACQPLEPAITQGNLSASDPAIYGYCSAGSGDLLTQSWEEPCAACLQSTTDQYYLSNFLAVLKGACAQQPAPGALLSMTGEIFSRSAVNVTVTTSDDSTNDSDDDSGGMNTPIIVGIAVGGALVLAGGIGLFWVYFRRKKRYEGATDATAAAAPQPRDPEAEAAAGNIARTNIGESIPLHITQHNPGLMYALVAEQRASASMDTTRSSVSVREKHQYYDAYESPPPTFGLGYGRGPACGSASTLVPHPAYIPGRSSRTTSISSLPSQSPSDSPSQSSVSSASFPLVASQDRRPQVPALITPSSSQYRQKKFMPPQITVQSASPIAEEDESHSLPDNSRPRTQNAGPVAHYDRWRM